MIDPKNVKRRFEEEFGAEPDLLVKSPGRINIIGEHTDYNEGFVLPTAIDKAIFVAVKKREDDLIRLYAEDFKEFFEIKIADLKRSENDWANYILGVVNQLIERGHHVNGFDLYLDGDVPLGAGLSSSAALECAAGFALNELFDFGIERKEIAKIGQMAEHTYAGVKCGIMDQFASVMSKKGYVIKLDCRDLSYEHVPLDLGDYEIVLLNTNVKHSLSSSAYNDRRESCEKGAGWVKDVYNEVNSLRDVNLEMLKEIVLPRDEDTFTKCKYVVEENLRLEKASQALKQGDIDGLGRQMFDAHEAISTEYEVSCAELDFLVDFAKSQDEIIGARMMGGGFGGCTINIVKKGHAKGIANKIAPIYKERFGLEMSSIFVSAQGGTQLLDV